MGGLVELEGGCAETALVDDFNVEIDVFVNGADFPPRVPTLTVDRNFLPRLAPPSLADVMPLLFLAPTDPPSSPSAPKSTAEEDEPFLFLPETESSSRASKIRGGESRREGGGDPCAESGRGVGAQEAGGEGTGVGGDDAASSEAKGGTLGGGECLRGVMLPGTSEADSSEVEAAGKGPSMSQSALCTASPVGRVKRGLEEGRA
jgi:hypothetical protein